MVNKESGSKDNSKDILLHRVQRSPKRRTHKEEKEWSTNEVQRNRKAKYMKNYRAVRRLKADATSYDFNDEYGRLESLLESFANSNEGSVVSFETHADGGKEESSRKRFYCAPNLPRW